MSHFLGVRRVGGADYFLELSISPELNERLVPHHARPALLARGIDIHNLVPMSKEEMMAKLD